MSFELESRGYQRDAVGELRVAVREYSSAVYVLPTGGGKTHVAAMVARLASKRDASVMFLVHRRELVRQAISTLRRAVPGMSIGVEAAGWPSMPWARLQVGSFPTVIKRPWLAEQMVIKLLIVDEAHHCRAASWEQVIGFWPEAKRIGLTATPERLDGKGLLPHFATMVIGPSIPELVVAGHLAPCRVVRISLDDKLKNFKRNRTGEIMGKDQAELLSSAPVIAAGASSYLRYAKGRRALFFGINRIHSERVCEQLRSAGVRAAHLDGLDTNARRDRVLRQFATGGLDLLGNCDLFSEGLDVPECDCVILGAPTRSVTRYLQAAGRGMRPGPGKVLLVIDAAGISHDLGLPDEVREWSLEEGEVGKERGKSKRKLRICDRCATVFYGLKCTNCGYASAPPPAEVELDLEEAKPAPKRGPKMTRAEMGRALGVARKAEDPVAAVHAIAKQNGYKPGWAQTVLGLWMRNGLLNEPNPKH